MIDRSHRSTDRSRDRSHTGFDVSVLPLIDIRQNKIDRSHRSHFSKGLIAMEGQKISGFEKVATMATIAKNVSIMPIFLGKSCVAKSGYDRGYVATIAQEVHHGD